ncbi:MAG: VWA domain-containing protein [Verrucomicrobiaceae bacterium]|nr:MAG: VWA domain-containing protein [Verrucomicrobiaceae bacterium]
MTSVSSPGDLLKSARRLVLAGMILLAVSCGRQSQPAPGASAAADPNALTVSFLYSSEKEEWLKAVTAEFNQSRTALPTGKTIAVEAVPMGSGDMITEILAGNRQPHLISPASQLFLKDGNDKSVTATGQPLTGPAVNLVLSPVVVAMWKPMAEALGWPAKPIGWAEIHALATDGRGWAARGFPQWGKFRFGHTHPDYSNSGMLAILAEIYAGAGKQRGLTAADLENPAVGGYLRTIESAVVHYGESTGFFGQKLFSGGPSYLSAAVLYENMVVGSTGKTDLPLVAVYPQEGTFWSDHPAAIVNRPWVSADQRAAAQAYLDYLMGKSCQERALALGFRPGDPSVPLASPIDPAHGVDPAQPRTLLEIPPSGVTAAARALWAANKKRSDITLVIDISGSMQEQEKMKYAREGAAKFVSALGDEDTLSVVAFNGGISVLMDRQPLGASREVLLRRIAGLVPLGGTALYDATGSAHEDLMRTAAPDRIPAIVVLSDGADSASKIFTLDRLLASLNPGAEGGGIRIFTIAYGSDAKKDVLERISTATQGRVYTGSPKDIDRVFRDIATFF